MSDPGPLWRRIGAILDRADLSTAEKLLLIVLEWYTNSEWVAWPSVPTLGRRMTATERTVYGLIAHLDELDVLSIDHGGGRRRSNHYRVTLQPFQGFSDEPARKTLKSTPETLKSTPENPEATSSDLSTYRSTDFSTPPPASKNLGSNGGPPGHQHAVQRGAPDGASSPTRRAGGGMQHVSQDEYRQWLQRVRAGRERAAREREAAPVGSDHEGGKG